MTTRAPRYVLRRIATWGAGAALIALLVGAAMLYHGQRRPLPWRPTARLSSAIDDRDLLDRVARRGKVGVVVHPGRLALPLDDGAEVLELFKIIEGGGFAALRHESPVVRSYAAFLLATTAPAQLAKLRDLLADPTSVGVGAYTDVPATTTVQRLIVDMLCSRSAVADAGAASAHAFLAAAGDDWRLLAVRNAIHACLFGLEGRAPSP